MALRYKLLNGLSQPLMEHIFNVRENTYNVRNFRTFLTRNEKTHIKGNRNIDLQKFTIMESSST